MKKLGREIRRVSDLKKGINSLGHTYYYRESEYRVNKFQQKKERFTFEKNTVKVKYFLNITCVYF